jgi:protein required for attachment to host cells
MTLRIVIADQSQARFLDVPSRHALVDPAAELILSERLTDPAAHLHDRDFKSDKPGRSFERGPLLTGRRGAAAHHAVGEDRSPRAHAAELFAQRIMESLEAARSRAEFDQLVLVAEPHFLGLLRHFLSAPLRTGLIAEVHKDLGHEQGLHLREHLIAALGAQEARSTDQLRR